MDAKDLAKALIAELTIMAGSKIRDRQDASYRAGMFDMTTHAVHVAHDLSLAEAREYVAEEVQERLAAWAD